MIELIKQSYKIINMSDDAYRMIEYAGRLCTNSHYKMNDESSPMFVSSLLKMEHMAMIEFAEMTVEFTTDRTVSHELVRHRLASFAQESQRYVKYNVLRFVLPPWMDDRLLGEWSEEKVKQHHLSLVEKAYILLCLDCYDAYHYFINAGWKPEQARKKLTGDVATKILVKTNFREWIHIFNLRYKGTTGRPDPTMNTLMKPLFDEMKNKYNIIFK